MPPLALTDNQLDLVQRAAALILPSDRCRFLQSIANRLGDNADPSDDQIMDALDFVLNNRGIITGAKAFKAGFSSRYASKQAQARAARAFTK
jgi:hypothetical protein